jgi:DNA-binding response OmpR family regulator
MTPKKILLLHEGRLLTDIFRQKLEAAGFAVETARSGEKGLASATERRPDAIVLDPVLPGADLEELVRKLRSSGGARQIPVVVLPTTRPATSDTAQRAGAEVVLARGPNPVADMIDALQSLLGMERTETHLRGLAFNTDESWLATSLNNMPATLTTLRRAIHEASRDGGDPQAVAEFHRAIHGFTEEMAVLGQRPLHILSAQMEALAFDLHRFPEMANRPLLRTLGQAVDFLATLLPAEARAQLRDPSTSQVLVVDDEEGARAIIMAAMQLAHLKSMAADTPSAGLAALGVQAFDLIFLDVGLPEMSGFELGNRIRALPMHEKTPIIFITGMATFQNRVQSSLSGGNDFVGKPFSLPELGLKALIWIFKGHLGQA